MEPLNRDQLLSKNAPVLIENYKLVERHLSEIYRAVVGSSSHTTSYTHNLRNQYSNSSESNMTIFLDRLVYRLKELFPGSTVEYIESKSAINGTIIERAVRIDWS
jgi:hypothetical protein